MGKTIKTGGTQALGPDPLEQQEAELIASADILGIPLNLKIVFSIHRNLRNFRFAEQQL